MDDVLAWLSNYAMDHGIGIIFDKKLPPDAPSDSWEFPPIAIINSNWYNKNELPFITAHEICHVLYGSAEYYHSACRGMESGESDANLGAIKLLLQYARETDMHFATYYQFANAFCIPKKHYYLIDAYLTAK